MVWTSCLLRGSNLPRDSDPAGERGTAERAQKPYRAVIGLMKQKGENGGLPTSRNFYEEVTETHFALMARLLAVDFSTRWTHRIVFFAIVLA